MDQNHHQEREEPAYSPPTTPAMIRRMTKGTALYRIPSLKISTKSWFIERRGVPENRAGLQERKSQFSVNFLRVIQYKGMKTLQATSLRATSDRAHRETKALNTADHTAVVEINSPRVRRVTLVGRRRPMEDREGEAKNWIDHRAGVDPVVHDALQLSHVRNPPVVMSRVARPSFGIDIIQPVPNCLL